MELYGYWMYVTGLIGGFILGWVFPPKSSNQNKTIKMKEETGYNEWKEMIDKMNQSPLIMEQSGCDFRWKIIQIVSGTKKHNSVDDIITEANKLIDWINSES